jgi:hypothetical protein
MPKEVPYLAWTNAQMSQFHSATQRAQRLEKGADITLEEMDKPQVYNINLSPQMKDPKTRQLPIRQPRGPPALHLLKRKPTAKYPGSLNFAYRTQQ